MEKIRIVSGGYSAEIEPIVMSFRVTGHINDIERQCQIDDSIVVRMFRGETRTSLTQADFLEEVEKTLNHIKLAIIKDLGFDVDELRVDVRTSAEKMKDELAKIDEHKKSDKDGKKAEFAAKIAASEKESSQAEAEQTGEEKPNNTES